MLDTYGKYVFLERSGDHTINQVLKSLKKIGVVRILLQDQGGWITYSRFAKRLKLEVVEVETDFGIIDPLHLIEQDVKTALLINTLPGYHAEQPMDQIATRCTDLGIICVADITGSIGTPVAEYGDVTLGSFGKFKPIHMEYGGFMSTNNSEIAQHWKENYDDSRREELTSKLHKVSNRQEFLRSTSKTVKKDLKHLDIIHKNSQGINVIIRFSSELEKKEIIDYCITKGFFHTECPRNIRVLVPAICIEVKNEIVKFRK
jgi:hypothetical protein